MILSTVRSKQIAGKERVSRLKMTQALCRMVRKAAAKLLVNTKCQVFGLKFCLCLKTCAACMQYASEAWLSLA